MTEVPTDAEGWRRLRGPALVAAQLAATWYVREDDTIGGWCVMPLDAPPSCGAPAVAHFLAADAALHIADLHNETIDGQVT